VLNKETGPLQGEVIYRCIHAACARPLPRRVRFCPYCGTAQQAGLRPPPPAQAARAPVPAPAPAPVPPPKPVQVPAAAPVAAPAPPARIDPGPGLPQRATQAPPPPPPVPAGPPLRQPVRLRYWLLALGMLWLIWLGAKPDTQKIDARVSEAVAMARDCRLDDAQAELIMLRTERARSAQIERVQRAIADAKPGCAKKLRRADAWKDTSTAIDKALKTFDFTKAASLLRAHTKGWGQDDETIAMHERIEAARTAFASSESVRKLLDEADTAIARGDYPTAVSKMEVCALMVDAEHGACNALKAKASALQQDMLRCVATGYEWFAGRCREGN
jgi:hypothetical protein